MTLRLFIIPDSGSPSARDIEASLYVQGLHDVRVTVARPPSAGSLLARIRAARRGDYVGAYNYRIDTWRTDAHPSDGNVVVGFGFGAVAAQQSVGLLDVGLVSIDNPAHGLLRFVLPPQNAPAWNRARSFAVRDFPRAPLGDGAWLTVEREITPRADRRGPDGGDPLFAALRDRNILRAILRAAGGDTAASPLPPFLARRRTDERPSVWQPAGAQVLWEAPPEVRVTTRPKRAP